VVAGVGTSDGTAISTRLFGIAPHVTILAAPWHPLHDRGLDGGGSPPELTGLHGRLR
jgi:hypothetical protein